LASEHALAVVVRTTTPKHVDFDWFEVEKLN
jgi:hypothetical protein